MKKEDLCRVFSRMPQLTTRRLTLRPLRVSDSADMYDYARRPDVTKYLLWRPHADASYTKRYLEYLAGRYRIGAHYEWAIVDNESGRMIGTCGFASIDCVNNSAELGYVLHPDFHGKGIMHEAASRVLCYGFDTLHLRRIQARYMVENIASRHVLDKLGMTFEGVTRAGMLVRGFYRDIGVCAILREEFKAE